MLSKDMRELHRWIWDHLPACRWVREGNKVTCIVSLTHKDNVEPLKGLPFAHEETKKEEGY